MDDNRRHLIYVGYDLKNARYDIAVSGTDHNHSYIKTIAHIDHIENAELFIQALTSLYDELLKEKKDQEEPPAKEMLAVDYIRERQRLHDSMHDNCAACPLNLPNCREVFCGVAEQNDPQKAVAIVAEWARSHPEMPKEET